MDGALRNEISQGDQPLAGKRPIAVLAPLGSLDSQPGVVNAIRFLCAAGYQVDVFAVRNLKYPQANVYPARIRFLPIVFNSPREPRVVVTLLFAIWIALVLRKSYAAVIASGVRALLAIWFISWLRPQKVINLQLELYIGPKLNAWAPKVFKWLERHAIRSAWFSIIHDQRRADMLASDAGIPRNSIELLPNSPYGSAFISSSRFLHKALGVSLDTRLLLAPGSIGPAFCSEEIVVSSQALPSEWRCVVHSAQPREATDPYIMQLHNLNVRGKVLFSLSPVPYDRITDLVGSARIGLALYGETGGPNTTEVGLASGKLGQFLQLGIPVIVSDYPGLREFVLKNGVGFPIADMHELPALISRIEADYAGYQKRALSAFKKHLDFGVHFKAIVTRIERSS